MIKKILVAYDGSAESYAAFLYGLGMAKKYEADLEILSVVRVLEPNADIESKDNLERGKELYENFFKKLRIKAKEEDIRIKTDVTLGHPAEQIILWAEKNDINVIILGNQIKKAAGQWILGSVPDSVVHQAHCTVIVVKDDHY